MLLAVRIRSYQLAFSGAQESLATSPMADDRVMGGIVLQGDRPDDVGGAPETVEFGAVQPSASRSA